MFTLTTLPFFQKAQDSKRILLAGAGGGFDIYAGIPLYYALKSLGKEVYLGNFSFSDLRSSNSQVVTPDCYFVQARDHMRFETDYFPERSLARWFATQGEQVGIYAFAKTGVKPLRESYRHIAKLHDIDTIVLVDGGTDSLMFGDEESLGTPHEDVCSLAAAYGSRIPNQILVTIGFGVDHFHGVSHYRFLENVAELSREGAYWGMWQLLKEMPEAQRFLDAIAHANEETRSRPSIVNNSIASAVRGDYGDVHFTTRTKGSNLWINPLMSTYWAFDLRGVVSKIQYYHQIKATNTIAELDAQLRDFRMNLKERRKHQRIPI